MYKKINLKENDIVLNRRLTNSGVTTGQINSFLKGSGYKLELKSCVCLVDEFDEIHWLGKGKFPEMLTHVSEQEIATKAVSALMLRNDNE